MRLTRATACSGIAATFVGIAMVVATASPAAAHGVGGLQPTDYVTEVEGVRPAIPGVSVRAVDLGSKIELRNEGRDPVTVLGYDDEPYLRVARDGVFENTRSPSVFLNQGQTITGRIPDAYDSTATPEWRRTSSGNVARWHDHRAHWMGDQDPPVVARDRSRPHIVMRNWEVPVRVDGRTAIISGDARWIPPPAPWPWMLGAIAMAAIVIALGRTRAWPRVLAIALGVLLVSEAVHILGGWGATTNSFLSKLGAGAYSIAGWVIGLIALIWLLRREPRDATPIVLIAALFLFIAGGLADITSLTRSQLPTTLAPWAARLTVITALGLGFGLMVTAALRLRPPPHRAPSPAQPPTPVDALNR
ncbi:MAG: hypothetical protein ACXW1S_01265 [Acidimicrobiia bacterium]